MSLHLDLHQGCCFQVNSSNWGLWWCGDRILAQKMSPWILFGAATQVACAGLSTVLIGWVRMREANYQIMSGWLLTFEILKYLVQSARTTSSILRLGKDRHALLPQFSGLLCQLSGLRTSGEFWLAQPYLCLNIFLVGRFQPHLMPQCGRINTIIIMLTKSMNKTSHLHNNTRSRRTTTDDRA